ncbi:MAG: HEAT repeat domain-containing protein [Deltaproteobacteria bacterium]|nr:HEAT repeat domain-containing protein [Deltaproteobacteria bacterium]
MPIALLALGLLHGCATRPQQAVMKLEHPDPEARMAAARILGKTHDPRWVPALLDRLHDSDPEVVQGAVAALGDLGHPGGIGPLIPLLDHPDPGVRYVTETVLAGFGVDVVFPLTAALKHARPRVQESAARLLGRIKDPSALVPLLLATKPSFPDRVRIAAVIALGRLRDARAVGPLMDSLYEKDSPALHEIPRALAKIGSPAVEPLIRASQRPDVETARMAVQALGEIGDARAVGPVLESLERRDPFLVQAAVDALIAMGEIAVVPLIQRAAAPGKAGNRAVEALEGIGAPAVPRFLAVLESDPHRFEAVAFEVLPAVGAPAAKPLMAAFRRNPFSKGDWAARLLTALGPAAIPVLAEGLNAGELAVRIRCAEALGEIGEAECVTPLIHVLETDAPVLPEVAGESLAKIGAPAVLPLIRILADPESPFHFRAETVLIRIGAPAAAPLIDMLNQRDAALQEKATRLLAEMKEAAVPDLMAHLTHPDVVMQNRCAEILVRIGGPGIPFLEAEIEKGDPRCLWRVVKILGEIGDPAGFPALMSAADHKDPAVRYFAVEGLGRIQDPRVVPILVDALPDRWAGHIAARALSGMDWRPGTFQDQVFFDFHLSESKAALKTDKIRALFFSLMFRGDFCKKEFALFALLDLFGDAVVPDLVRILNTEDSAETAWLFAESDVDALAAAGRDWLYHHGGEAYLTIPDLRLLLEMP